SWSATLASTTATAASSSARSSVSNKPVVTATVVVEGRRPTANASGDGSSTTAGCGAEIPNPIASASTMCMRTACSGAVAAAALVSRSMYVVVVAMRKNTTTAARTAPHAVAVMMIVNGELWPSAIAATIQVSTSDRRNHR